MDAEITASGKLEWPLAEVEVPAKKSPGSLGLLAFFGTPGNETFVPLTFGVPGVPPSSSGLVLLVRSGVVLEDLKWRMRPDQPDAQFPKDWSPITGDLVPGATAPITVDMAPSGTLLIEVTGREKETPIWRDLILRVAN